jgi:hypothetical protein
MQTTLATRQISRGLIHDTEPEGEADDDGRRAGNMKLRVRMRDALVRWRSK